MKKRIYHILPLVILLNTVSSCREGFLDQVPDDRLTIDQIFQRRTETERYLANIYSRIRDEADQWAANPWLGAADEADMTWARAGYDTYFMNIGSWDPNSGFFDFWRHYYQGVRSATYFIQRVGENQEILQLPNGNELITQYRAEARALRAYFYFCLFRQYGPVIILPGEEVASVDSLESLQLPRNSMDECIDYIISELDKAISELPEWHENAQDYARIQGSAIKAIKSRVLLYAASPLYNGNTDYANFKNPDGKQLISQQFDAEKWKRAADAAKAVIDMDRFSLYKETQGDTPDPFLSYQNLFLNSWNNEVIFARADNGLAAWEQHCTPRFGGGWSGVAVTQQQVDAYRMASGKRINEDGSGYVENGFSAEDKQYTKAGTYNMWVNREPRFYVSVSFNGSEWINHDEGIKKVELFLTGNTGKQGSYDFSRTGYLVRKNVHPNSNPRIGSYVRRPIILFRLGEFYLNYAEALNEYNPGNPDILKYVNLIRERAGIPGLPDGLSQAEMRQEIRQERRVELAFECHRYFDTRRWKIAEQTDGGSFYGMNVDAGTGVNDPEFYKRTVFERRVFDQKHYFFSIPQFDIDRNIHLVQNPGW